MIVVKDNDIRLDKYLASNTDKSRALIEKMLDGGFILVNGEIKKGSYKVKEGDTIEIDDTFKIDTDIKPEKMDIDIVYEDDDLMIINKPSGMVVHPGSGNYAHTLVNGLLAYTKALSDLNGSARPGIVHRIDKDTSGLMVVAKNNIAHTKLSDMFSKHEIKRTYIALLWGNLPYEKATIDAPIKRDPKAFNKMGVFEGGKKAITHLKVLKRYNGYTLVSLNLETGRTHQIRVHSKYMSHPILGDSLYGTINQNTPINRQALHAYSISFIHPITHSKIDLKCELPQDMKFILENLD